MKAIVLLLLAGIILSLGSGLFFLTREKEDPNKLLNALKVRIVLSIALVVFLVASFSLGWIQP